MSKKRLIITKLDVFKALATEPLYAGYFYLPRTVDSQCRVCAVGAVMRSKLKENMRGSAAERACRNDDNGSGGNYRVALRQRKYLSALSIYFEKSMSARPGVTLDTPADEKIVGKLFDFVHKNFPKKIQVTVDV